MRLQAATESPPIGYEDLLADLGGGENGFSGTPVHTGELTPAEFLHQCCAMRDPASLPPGLVPQTIFWALDDENRAVGMARVRHYLNHRLLAHGGHVGYFIHSRHRGMGYGKEILRLVLVELRKLGVTRALITTTPDNARSIRVIESNGGRFCDLGADPETGIACRRYWIDLTT